MKKTILLMFSTVLFGGYIFAQNVGINATGATPDAGAGLDVNFTNKGVLLPRVNIANLNAIAPIAGSTTTSLLVYNTNTTTGTGYYYWNGSRWVRIFDDNNGKFWSLSGNATLATDFIGTTNNQPLIFRTNNVERMRVANDGKVYINTATSNGTFNVSSNFSLNYPTDIATINGTSTNSSGTGIMAVGQNGSPNALVIGSGTASNGYTVANFGYFSTPGVGQGAVYQDAYGTQWLVGQFTGSAYRKISGNGTVNTVVEDLQGKRVLLSAPEAPENLFMDYGVSQLKDGKIYVSLDPILTKNIIVDEKHPLKVYIQVEGQCNGVYVTNKSAEGFEVIELNNGVSNIPFSYSIVAQRGKEIFRDKDGKVIRIADYDERFPDAPEILKTTKAESSDRK